MNSGHAEATPLVAAALVQARHFRRRAQAKTSLMALLIAGLTGWTAYQTNFNLFSLVDGLGHAWDLLARMMPPDESILIRLGGPVIETVQMAFVATTLAIPIAICLAYFAAENIRPSRTLGYAVRLFLNIVRVVPEIVWAILLVSAVGLGAFPGTLALLIHAIGGMGKWFYEAIETADRGVIEAFKACGGNRFKIFWMGVLPNVLPNILSICLMYWEYNNRSATILGLVGAGGIGLTFTHAIQSFEYREATTCLVIIVLIVSAIDYASAVLRRRII